ncbi:MAG: peptidoglycan DD-metalloendopeptidase family protein [Clostridia bacterium]|nr:peptidoglycan DD-metalloendopeptidase family protein [Clostridia bacterium]
MKLKDATGMPGKRISTLVLATLLALLTVATVSGYNFGYNLYIDDVYMGSFASEEDAKKVAGTILDKDGIDLSGKEKIEFGIMDDERFTDVSEACDNFRKQDERFTEAYSLYLDGERIFSSFALQEVIDVKYGYLARFHEEGAVSVEFTESCVMAKEFVVKEFVVSKDEAYNMLEGASDVKTVIKMSYYESIPYETVEIGDATLYVDETAIESEGVTGEKYVEYTTEKINGETVSESITGETVLTEVEARVIRKGEKNYQKGVAVGTFKNPAEGVLTSPFGPRWGRMHKGIDIAATTGTPMYAADGGEVIYSGWMSGYGYLVQIDHKNGYTTYYAHCSTLHVNVGDKVAKGDLIADMGSTGNSTGPHLHFEIRLDNVPMDPEDYVNYR